MHVSGPDGRHTEVFGPCLMERLGEVFVLNGRVMKAADVMRDYKPEPEQRGGLSPSLRAHRTGLGYPAAWPARQDPAVSCGHRTGVSHREAQCRLGARWS
jgi:hypothetical protein